MKRYFKVDWESEIGPGFVMHEFDGEVPTRQVEKYGGRWFNSQTEHHAELGPGLVDQALSELAFNPEQEISAAEFEESWWASGAGSG